MSLVHSKTLAGFDDKKMARQCLRELRRGQLWRPEMQICVQSESKGHEELPLKFTHARGALLQGLVLGAIAGMVAGISIAAVEARGSNSFQPVYLIVFAVMGMILGGFAGALVGPMNPNPSVDVLERDGGLVLLIASPDIKDIEWANRVFHKWGAKPAPPPVRAGAALLRPRSAAHAPNPPPQPSHG